MGFELIQKTRSSFKWNELYRIKLSGMAIAWHSIQLKYFYILQIYSFR